MRKSTLSVFISEKCLIVCLAWALCHGYSICIGVLLIFMATNIWVSSPLSCPVIGLSHDCDDLFYLFCLAFHLLIYIYPFYQCIVTKSYAFDILKSGPCCLVSLFLHYTKRRILLHSPLLACYIPFSFTA